RHSAEEDEAHALVKIYTMALAQGIARTQWFEGRDPKGEPPGFGLLKRDGKPRASYTAMKELTKRLGPSPKYVGWLALGPGYGFVFEGGPAPVLVAWMPAGKTGRALIPAALERIDPVRGTSTKLKASQALELTGSPVLVVGLPAALVRTARDNASKPFPWGGNYVK